MSGDTADDLTRYRETLVRWGAALKALEIPRANALFDESHTLFKRLRNDPDGRSGISALRTDPNPHVRGSAAAHSLLWDPDTALEVLDALEKDDSAPPDVRVSAHYTAEEWRAGRLNLDW